LPREQQEQSTLNYPKKATTATIATTIIIIKESRHEWNISNKRRKKIAW
jgi:hypothetical protein